MNNPMSINRWMDRQNMIYPHHGTLSGNKRDRSMVMDKTWKNYAEWKKPGAKNPTLCMILLYKMSVIGKSIREIPNYLLSEAGGKEE